MARALAEAKPPVPVEVFVQRLRDASDGNFKYVSYVVADIAARRPGEDPLALDDLPKGLSGYYDQFWPQMDAVSDAEWAAWDGLYRPTIELLGIAAEAVTPGWLAAQIGRPASEIRERALRRWERLLSRETRNGQVTWRVVHRSVADFLAEKDPEGLRDAHVGVAEHYAVALRDGVATWDEYGLRHTATHLAEGGRRSGQPGASRAGRAPRRARRRSGLPGRAPRSARRSDASSSAISPWRCGRSPRTTTMRTVRCSRWRARCSW